jgi:hypothetical protein
VDAQFVYNQKGELCGFQSKPAVTLDWNPWLREGYSSQPGILVPGKKINIYL